MPADAVKRNSRRGHKSSISRAINYAKKCMALKRKDEVEESLSTLEDRFTSFEKAHLDFHNDLEDEAEIIESEEFFENVENDFVEALLAIRTWLDQQAKVLEKKPLEKVDSSSDDLSRTELLNLMHLPKLELSTFDGNPLKYHSFMARFDEHVEKVAKDPQIKLTRLLQCCIGPAGEAIEATALIGGEKGYIEARETLRKRFGNNHLIAS
jgi:hypothetical protein